MVEKRFFQGRLLVDIPFLFIVVDNITELSDIKRYSIPILLLLLLFDKSLTFKQPP